jgi:protein-disulfide isomerase
MSLRAARFASRRTASSFRLAPCVLAALLGCPQPQGAPSDPEGAKPAATVGGHTITLAELDRHIKDNLFQQATEGGDKSKLYEIRSEAIESVIDEQLLEAEAKKRGMTTEAMLAAEEAKAKPVEQGDIQAFYERVKSRLGETKLEVVADQIRQRLEGQRRAEARQAFVKGLRDAAKVSVALEPPRIPVVAEGPSRGPETAPVTIVEFSDYQCPFCKRAEPTVHQIAQRYPEKVRIVYRHFPLDNIHPQARGASEAAACAEEQGKFWEYHARVFESSPKLEKEALRQAAEKAKLDLAAYDQCVAERRHQARVEKDLEAGRAAGVSGTPAFFVNGIPLSGAQPPEKFVDLIEKELQQPKPPAS